MVEGSVDFKFAIFVRSNSLPTLFVNSRGIPVLGRPRKEQGACPQCGSASHVGRSLCLACLLSQGLGGDAHSDETLEDVLGEIDVCDDADWRLGNYQILEEIGRGGVGVIYRARQRHSRRIVALKRILSCHADSQEMLARFRRETEAAARLDHPNILPIYEVSDSEDGLPFFSMKFASGGSLLEAVPALRSEPRRAVALMVKVARAMQYAHEQGILHRDLKPDNIMLDASGEPLVSDFGLAKRLDTKTDLTHTLTVFGTAGYIAPEQVNTSAANLTPAADVYSLGAILFDLLTGRPPFRGEHALEVIQQASQRLAPKLRTLAPILDRDLETICAKCLEREPSARYRSAGDLAQDLEACLDGRLIVARPVSPPVRIWRWSRRNPIVAGMTVLLLALGTVLGALIWRGGFAPAEAGGTTGVAVLPFESLSEDKENAFFANGVYDGVSTKLEKVADLKVISHNSVIRYRGARNTPEIGRALNVAYVLEGSVRREAGRIHLNARLIDTRTDRNLWAEKYDCDINQIFAMQSEIAQRVADRLGARVSSAEKAVIKEPPTTNLVAYDLYIQARSLIDESLYYGLSSETNLFKAAELLNQAIARDPVFLLAYCELAEAHDGIYWAGLDHTPGRLDLAKSAIDSALRLKPDSGEAHLASAVHSYYGYLDYDSARDELTVAVRTMPNAARIFELSGYIDRRQGRWYDAARNLERSIELDPRNGDLLFGAGFTYLCSRDYKRAREIADRGIALPTENNYARLVPGWIDFHERADIRPWHAALEKLLTENPASARDLTRGRFFVRLYERDPAAAERILATLDYPVLNSRGPGAVKFSPAYAYGLVARMKGDAAGAYAAFSTARADQEKAVRAAPDDASKLCFLGLIDASLGRKEEALREGRRALQLLPVTKDALNGTEVLYFYAVMCAWTGERQQAFEKLETLAKLPSGVSYGEIRLDPFWDPLRGDPRFDKIAVSLAPK